MYCCTRTGSPRRTAKTLSTSISSGHAEHMKVSTTPGRATLETMTRTLMWNLGGPPVSAPEWVGGSAPSTRVASTLTSSPSLLFTGEAAKAVGMTAEGTTGSGGGQARLGKRRRRRAGASPGAARWGKKKRGVGRGKYEGSKRYSLLQWHL
jgi:hypothetical protein